MRGVAAFPHSWLHGGFLCTWIGGQGMRWALYAGVSIALFVAIGYVIEKFHQYRKARRATMRWVAALNEELDRLEVRDHIRGKE